MPRVFQEPADTRTVRRISIFIFHRGRESGAQRKREASYGGLEFPGFGGDPLCAAYEPLRIARDSGRRDDYDASSDCKTYRYSPPHRLSPALGSCKSVFLIRSFFRLLKNDSATALKPSSWPCGSYSAPDDLSGRSAARHHCRTACLDRNGSARLVVVVDARPPRPHPGRARGESWGRRPSRRSGVRTDP